MKISELPAEIREKALEYQRNETIMSFCKDTDRLGRAFSWTRTLEGSKFWRKWASKVFIKEETPTHYDNSNGSLYLFAEQQKLNSYEFEVLKRIVRCRKKGEFLSDIKKTINVLNIYLEEQKHNFIGETELLNK